MTIEDRLINFKKTDAYKIIESAFFKNDIINVILGNYPYRSYCDYDIINIDASHIIWTLHILLMENKTTIEDIDRIINNIEISENNVCVLLYFIYLCKIKEIRDGFLVFHYEDIYNTIKNKEEKYINIICYNMLVKKIDDVK